MFLDWFKRYSYEAEDLTIIGPECFAGDIDGDPEVALSWKGQNYYKACGEYVKKNPDGSETTCVLPVQVIHKHATHMDFDDNMRGI